MMSVNDYYEIMLYALAKNNSQGYFGGNDFNTVINQAQRNYSAYLLGTFNSYQPGRPISRVELGNNSVVRQRLAPTIYGYNLNVDSTGFSPYPGDYLQADAMWSYYGANRIRYVQQDSLWSYYNSVIDPYQTNPFYLIEDVGVRFYPQDIGMARMSYVRNPPNMVWGSVDDANGVPVYSEAHSTQPIWDDASSYEIIVRGLALCGVNLQIGVVIGYANEIKEKGV